MPRSITRLALLAVAALLVPAAAAGARPAAKAPSIYQSKRLWATVNVCDTAAHPDTVGIRASMPGSGSRKERMYMRFQVQFFRRSDGAWHNLAQGGDSGFVKVGSAKYRRRESGWNFELMPPPKGGSYLVRGAVTFEWRRGDEVVRRARKRTRGGHPGTRGADPSTFSAGNCTIVG